MGMDSPRPRSLFYSLFLLAFIVTGCALAPGEDVAGGEDFDTDNDPLEPLNRVVFDVNLVIDGVLVRPMAELYLIVVPQVGRDMVRDFLENLETPVILANDALQWEWQRAGITTTRFVINSTLGIGGLFDVAEGMGYPRHEEDFGQTLAVYGSGEGWFLMLPLLGPSTARDAIGLGVDYFLDPLNYLQDPHGVVISRGRTVAHGVDLRSRNIKTLDTIERTSIDFYATVRSLYRQRRNDQIRNGALPALPAAPGLGAKIREYDGEKTAAAEAY